MNFSPKSQRGTTLLIVMVIVALSTMIAAQLIEQSTYSQRRTKLMLGREQAYQLALGGEALARQWLTKGFARDENVHLNQAWATTPFEFPINGGVIRATIKDAQSCFNLNSILEQSDSGRSPGSPPPPPRPGPQSKPIGEQIFIDILQTRLTDVEIMPESLVATLVDWMDSDIQPYGPDGAEDDLYEGLDFPYRAANAALASKTELRLIKGFSKKVYESIKEIVCILPGDENINKINVNTLAGDQADLLKAVLGVEDASTINDIISNRPEEGYKSEREIFDQIDAEELKKIDEKRKERIDTKSDYFLINLEVEFKGAAFRMGTLVKRSEQKDAPFSVVTRYFGDY